MFEKNGICPSTAISERSLVLEYLGLFKLSEETILYTQLGTLI